MLWPAKFVEILTAFLTFMPCSIFSRSSPKTEGINEPNFQQLLGFAVLIQSSSMAKKVANSTICSISAHSHGLVVYSKTISAVH